MAMHSTGGSNIERIESGVDWLTWVSPRTDGETALERLGERLVRQQADRGSKVAPLKIEGYNGLQAEQCAYGYRKDSAYLRLSGKLAASHWSDVPFTSGRATRLDVQTTIWLRTSRIRFGSEVFKARTGKGHQQVGRPLRRVCSQGNHGLYIGTVGTRTSRRYLRIYDKGVESGCSPAGVCWRIELEAKKDLSTQLYREGLTAPDHNQWCVDVCERTISAVHGRWPLASGGTLPLLPSAPELELPSIVRTCAWLETSVRPSIERLLPHVGIERLLELLGLDGYASSDRSHTEEQ